MSAAQFYLGWDGGRLRWLGDAAGVARHGDRMAATSVVVWRVDPLRERVEQVLAHRAEDTWTLVAEDGRVIVTMDVAGLDSPEVLEVIDRLSTAGPVVLDRVAPEAWPSGDVDSYWRWGFSHPRPTMREDALHTVTTSGWRAEFCPELIASHLAGVGEDDRANYLHGVYLRLMLHVEHAGLPVEEAEGRIDSVMYELNPALLNLVSQVQMRALDGGDART